MTNNNNNIELLDEKMSDLKDNCKGILQRKWGKGETPLYLTSPDDCKLLKSAKSYAMGDLV